MKENYTEYYNEEEKYIQYFEEYVKEDEEDILTICQTASKIIYDKFKLRFDDPRLLGTTMSKIYTAFTDRLEALENEYSDFTINICDRLALGYSTNIDEDDEKQGNFMIFIRHLNATKKDDMENDPTAKAVDIAVKWNSDNYGKQPQLLKEIAIKAYEELKKMDILLFSSELVIPVFVTTYETIVNYLKIKRKEEDLFDYEINFMGCFYIGAREGADETDDIYIRPNIESKLKLKDDNKATSKHE